MARMTTGIFSSTSLGLGAMRGLGEDGGDGWYSYNSPACEACRDWGDGAALVPQCYLCPDAPSGPSPSTPTPSGPTSVPPKKGGGGVTSVPPLTVPPMETGLSMGSMMSSPLVLAAGVALLGVGAVILYGRSKKRT